MHSESNDRAAERTETDLVVVERDTLDPDNTAHACLVGWARLL